MKENKNSQKENKKTALKKCFIIMPISTPKSMLEKYAGGKDHFEHVLNQLFIPAIKKSDLIPIPPTTEGSEVIHGSIIKNIEMADLVLCDMSSLNPNVFFEFGIRISLNKPVALVVDDMTPEIPFDSSIIHHHIYRSALQNWTYEEDIEKLSKHINESIKKSKGKNSLWKYFSLSSMARPLEEKEGIEGKIDYLTVIVESLKEKTEKRQKPINMASAFLGKSITVEIIEKAKEMGLNIGNLRIDDESKNIFLEIKEEIDPVHQSKLSSITKKYGWGLLVVKWGLGGPPGSE